MEIKESKHGEVTVLQPVGSMDTRNALEFEQRVVQLLDEGASRVVIDFSTVEQLTSSGIRVLVMMARRLVGVEGALVLCALSDHIRTILDVSGLKDYFIIAPSKQKAIEDLSSAPKMSKISVLAKKLLDGGAEHQTSTGARFDKDSRGTKKRSKLSDQVAQLLSRSDTRSPRSMREETKKARDSKRPKGSDR
jgi:stage II sporulation protein AA (anti-sigma F factor antagonist)